jgi:hypothetical protein
MHLMIELDAARHDHLAATELVVEALLGHQDPLADQRRRQLEVVHPELDA